MTASFKGGAWPVMLTPFRADNKDVDYEALTELTNWYIDNGCSGLFSDCQSSEMFFLSLEERAKIAKTVIEAARGRVSVIVSGHISDGFSAQKEELLKIAALHPDALIFITNRFARASESDEVWLENLKRMVKELPADLPLGLYECPYPYKRLVSDEALRWCADSGRFHFLKDTCCDLETLKRRAQIAKGSNLKIYNANTSTLLPSLKAVCAGVCGVIASFQMKLYAWLFAHTDDARTAVLADRLTITSLIERQWYPVNAKYYLHHFEGLKLSEVTRTRDEHGLTPTFRDEVRALRDLTAMTVKSLGIEL